MLGIMILMLVAGSIEASGNTALQCVLLNPLLSLIPVNLIHALENLGTECSLESCGQVDGLGYFDVYCNLQCQLATYPTGTCYSNVEKGIAKCICNGNGVSLLQTDFTVCQILGACACQTCTTGGLYPQHYNTGVCRALSPNTVQVNCY